MIDMEVYAHKKWKQTLYILHFKQFLSIVILEIQYKQNHAFWTGWSVEYKNDMEAVSTCPADCKLILVK